MDKIVYDNYVEVRFKVSIQQEDMLTKIHGY